jgi:hypothetical protein
MFFSLLTWRKTTKNIFINFVAIKTFPETVFVGKLFSTFFLLLLVLLYLFKVGFANTGLAALIQDSFNLEIARAKSSTLLDSITGRYSLALIEKVFAPLCASFWTIELINQFQQRNIRRTFFATAFIALSFTSALLSGARSPSLLVLTSVCIVAIVYRWHSLSFKGLIAFAIILLIASPVITAASTKDLSPRNLGCQTFNIIDRTIFRGSVDNYWYISYQSDFGSSGFSTIPKLAQFLNIDPININNEVAKINLYSQQSQSGSPLNWILAQCADKFSNVSDGTYVVSNPETSTGGSAPETRVNQVISREDFASANASYVINLYVSFGIWGYLLAFIFLLFFDLIFVYLSRLNRKNFIVGTSCLVVPIITLIFSQINTALLSNGLLLVPIFMTLIQKIENFMARYKND